VSLLIVLVLVTLVIFAVFLGGGLVAQGYLYQAPADRFPLRALAGAALVGSFITFWVLIDKRNPRKYDTFFEFAPYTTKEFDEFEAVRWPFVGGKRAADASGNPTEATVKFKRGVGAKSKSFFEEGSNAEFKLNSSTHMTVAIKVKPDPDADPIRLNARLKKDAAGRDVYAKDKVDGLRFEEERGSRYVQAEQMGTLFVPSRGTVALALLINFLHFAVWFVALWPILQFTRGHAVLLAAAFGLFTMILVMPLLFKPNREPKPPAAEAPKAAWVEGAGDRGQGTVGVRI
jgi:hypothetical protein